MAEETPNVEARKSGWMDWLKDPKNAVTAAVFVGSLLTDRNPGQSKLGAVAQRGLGTLAFRGQMEEGLRQQGVQQRQEQRQEQESQSVQQYRQAQTQQGAQGVQLQKDQLAQTAELQREGFTNQQNVAKIQQTQTPEQAGKLNAEAEEARARAAYYGAQTNAKDGLFQSPYEADMFKSWSEGRIAADPTKPPTPAEWLSYIQPYRNANAVAMSLMGKGVMPTVRMEKDGSVTVSVSGVGDPTNPNATSQPGLAPPASPATTLPGGVTKSVGDGWIPDIAPAKVTARRAGAPAEAAAPPMSGIGGLKTIARGLQATTPPTKTTEVQIAVRRLRSGKQTVEDIARLRAIPREELSATFQTLKPMELDKIYGGP